MQLKQFRDTGENTKIIIKFKTKQFHNKFLLINVIVSFNSKVETELQ